MAVISFKNVKISYDHITIIRDCSFRLKNNERMGLIGNNGSGKTTIMQCVLGELKVKEGSVQINKDLKIGYFSQFSQLESTKGIKQILEETFVKEKKIEQEISWISEKLDNEKNKQVLSELTRRQTILFEEMERLDGWGKIGRIDIILKTLKFNEKLRNKPISKLSEGWKNRAAFAQIILNDPDILLLDEPTNFLDTEGLIWLEKWLAGFHGAAMIISHDRNFLNNTVTRIIEIENNRIHEYSGNYNEYAKIKSFKRKHLDSEFEREAELMALERNSTEENERKRESGERLVKKAEIERGRTPRPVDKIITDLYDELKFPNQLLKISKLSKSYPSEDLFKNLNLNLVSGDRLIIYGPNGCGKSTLLNILTNEESANEGKIRWSGEDNGFVSFAQVAKEIDKNKTLSHAITITKIAYSNSKKKSNAFLKLMGFSENDMKKRVGKLSGGELSRAVLAFCLLSGEPVIILDEPTNHLDLPSIRVMERALMFFPGAVIASSHDRFFIDSVATSMLIFEEGKINHFLGDFSMYYGKQGAGNNNREVMINKTLIK